MDGFQTLVNNVKLVMESMIKVNVLDVNQKMIVIQTVINVQWMIKGIVTVLSVIQTLYL